MIPAHILCNPNYWPSIQKDSEILAERIADMDRVRAAQEQLAKTFERAGVMLHVSRRHNTSNGRHVRILCSEDVYEALSAALQVAYDDPEYVPDEYREAVDELWREIVGSEVVA